VHPLNDDQARAQITRILRHNDIHLKSPTYLHLLRVGSRSDRETVVLLAHLEGAGLVTYEVTASDGDKVERSSIVLAFDADGRADPLVFVRPAEPARWRAEGYSDDLDAPRIQRTS
jgi:hypothetical protein